MATLVVPLDGSPFAERALRPAFSIAARLDSARVVLVRCSPDDVDVARRTLDDRARLFGDIADIDIRIIERGDPVDAILATATEQPDTALCMATRGRGGIGAAVLGSVATQIVHRSAQPLVLVGPNCRTTLLPAERGRLLVCSDGSAFSNSVVPAATAWCDRLGLEPWLTEVVGPDEDPEPADRPHPNREVEAATERLGALASQFGALGEPARVEVLHGAPGRSIPRRAERLPAALNAIATHGRSGLTRVALGSVATEIVRHAPCPVLITRPDAADRHGAG